MTSPAHEFILDLEPDVSTGEGRRYHASLVARAATDGHWNAWLEFVGQGEPSVLRTGIETHQAGEAALHHWAASLTDVYLGGALNRAQRYTPVETIAHRWALRKAATPLKLLTAAFDPFMLFALGEHVLRRELQLLRRATLLALIIKYDLNPRALNVSTFTKPQLVAFIVTAVEYARRGTVLTDDGPEGGVPMPAEIRDSVSCSYGFGRRLGGTLAETVERVTAALKQEGFGVLTEINVKETLKKKLDADFRGYVILGACNPPLAHKALTAEPQIGLLLPCNVVVQEAPDGGGVLVTIADPRAMFSLVDNPALQPVVDDVDARLRRVIAALA